MKMAQSINENQDVPDHNGSTTSSIGAGWPPREASFYRMKGFYTPSIIDSSHKFREFMREFKEVSILSYRNDPGVPILWWSGIVVLLAMSLRIFGAWYRIIYRIEEKDGMPHLLMKVKTRGLMADEARLIKRLQHSLMNITEPIDLNTPV